MGSTSKQDTVGFSFLLKELVLPRELLENIDLFPGMGTERKLRIVEGIKTTKDIADKTLIELHEVPLIAEVCFLIHESGEAGIPYRSVGQNYKARIDPLLKGGFFVMREDETIHFKPLVGAIIEQTKGWDIHFEAIRRTLTHIRACPLEEDGMVSLASYKGEWGAAVGEALRNSFEATKQTLKPLDILESTYPLRRMAPMPSLKTRRSADMFAAFRGHVSAHFIDDKHHSGASVMEEYLAGTGHLSEYQLKRGNITGRKFSVDASGNLIDAAREFGATYANCLQSSITNEWNNSKAEIFKASTYGSFKGQSVRIDREKLFKEAHAAFVEIGRRTAEKLKSLK